MKPYWAGVSKIERQLTGKIFVFYTHNVHQSTLSIRLVFRWGFNTRYFEKNDDIANKIFEHHIIYDFLKLIYLALKLYPDTPKYNPQTSG